MEAVVWRFYQNWVMLEKIIIKLSITRKFVENVYQEQDVIGSLSHVQ